MNNHSGPKGLSIGSLVFLGLVAAGLSACSQEQASESASAAPIKKGGLDQTGPYEVVEGWFKPGIEGWDQPVITVAVDNADRIFIGNTNEMASRLGSLVLSADGSVLEERSTTASKPASEMTDRHHIMVLNGNGEVIENWNQWDELIELPHNLDINPYDPERHLWVVDREGHQIFKFTNDGEELVMTLGEKGVAGDDESHFNRPAALAFLPDGSFYVADGYGNSRVVKFDKDGNYLFEWGTKGSEPGQFDLVHSVFVDSQNRVYTADRSNRRIQVFDENGEFLDEWTDVGSPTRIRISKDQSFWMADAMYNRFAKFNLNGELQTYWGVMGDAPGALDNPHDFDVDENGNMYQADAWNNRLQKFVPGEDVDSTRVIGQDFEFEDH